MRFLFPCLLILITHSICAQQLREFGDVKPEEVKQSISATTDAVILFNFGKYYLDKDLKVVIEHHVRLKIINKEGVRYANVALNYEQFVGFTSVQDIMAASYSEDIKGEIVKTILDKKLVVDKPTNERYGQKLFYISNVKQGSIIEYKYKERLPVKHELPDWYFQEQLPVKQSYVEVKLPDYFRYNLEPVFHHPFETHWEFSFKEFFVFDNQKMEAQGKEQTFSMNDFFVETPEPFSATIKDNQDHIHLQVHSIHFPGMLVDSLNPSWYVFMQQLWDDPVFTKGIEGNMSMVPQLDNILKHTDDEMERMRHIYDYVRTSIKCNGENKVYPSQDATKVWGTKTLVSNTEANILLMNLLKRYGITAVPVLCSTRENGKIDQRIPAISSFNKTVVCATAGGTEYILDASYRFLPFGLIPPDLLNTHAFVLSPEKPRWLYLQDTTQVAKNAVTILGCVKFDSVYTGNVYVNSSDYIKAERVKYLVETNADSFRRKYLNEGNEYRTFHHIVANEFKDDLALAQEFDFKSKPKKDGMKLRIRTNLFSGFNSNPLTAKERMSDLDFGSKQEVDFTGAFSYTPEYEMDVLPKFVALYNRDSTLSFVRETNATKNAFTIRYLFKINSSHFAKERYGEVHTFYQKLFASLNEDVVLKRK